MAAAQNHIAIVSFLLRAKADVNVVSTVSSHTCTPLVCLKTRDSCIFYTFTLTITDTRAYAHPNTATRLWYAKKKENSNAHPLPASVSHYDYFSPSRAWPRKRDTH